MKMPFEQPNRFASNRPSAPANRWIRRQSCISLFNWLIEEGNGMKSKSILMMLVFAIVLAGGSLAAQTPSVPATGGTLTADRVIDKAIEQERTLQKKMTTLHPMIETYTQKMEPHPD